MKKPKLFWFAVGAYVVYALMVSALVGTGLYVLSHFVQKFW